jgi:histone deacetylase 1/2
MEDLNSREYLERVKGIVLQGIRDIGGPPSVQMMGESILFVI